MRPYREALRAPARRRACLSLRVHTPRGRRFGAARRTEPAAPRRTRLSGNLPQRHAARTRSAGVARAGRRTRGSTGATGATAHRASGSTRRSAISRCVAPTVCGPTNSQWWSTTPSSRSATWCAAPTCAIDGATDPPAAPARATDAALPARAGRWSTRTAKNCPSRPAPRRSIDDARRRGAERRDRVSGTGAELPRRRRAGSGPRRSRAGRVRRG